jgi:hypothetical protein
MDGVCVILRDDPHLFDDNDNFLPDHTLLRCLISNCGTHFCVFTLYSVKLDVILEDNGVIHNLFSYVINQFLL